MKAKRKEHWHAAILHPMHLQPALHDEHSRPKLSYPISENLAKMGFYYQVG